MKKFLFGTIVGMILGPISVVKLIIKLSELSPETAMSDVVGSTLDSLSEVEGDDFAEWLLIPTRLGVPKKINLPSEEKADEILDELEGLVASYGYVDLSSLKELVGLRTTYHDRKLGWPNTDDFVRIGAKIVVPSPILLRA